MYVQAALTYAEAQMRIDDMSINDEVTAGLRRLNNLAKILKQRRQQNGFVGPIQSSSSMHHYKCVALYKDINLQRGRL